MTRTTISGLLAACVLLLAGCGGDAETTTGATGNTSTSETATETTPAMRKPAPTPLPPRPTTIVIVVDQGRPRGGIKRPRLDKGQKVVLVVRADVGDEVHVHGYEVTKALTPGKPARIPLTLKLAGRFEVELHHPDALLAVLEVRP